MISEKPKQELQSMPFDPGFSQFNLDFPQEVLFLLKDLSKIKNKNQLYYRLQMLEGELNDIVTVKTAFCYGALLYAGFLKYRYGQHNPVTIYGNPFIHLPAEERKNYLSLNLQEKEYQNILTVMTSLDQTCKHYLRRSSKINPLYSSYINLYIEFVSLNRSLIDLKETSDIQFPDKIQVFNTLSIEELDAIYDKILLVVDKQDYKGVFKILDLL